MVGGKTASSGVAAMREQIKKAMDAAELEVQAARARAHLDGAAYAAGKIEAYKFALAIMHS